MDKPMQIKKPADLFMSPMIQDGPRGPEFQEVEIMFCDASGFGLPTEPALTKEQALKRITEMMKEHGELYSCIVDTGQFQVKVGVYKKVAA